MQPPKIIVRRPNGVSNSAADRPTTKPGISLAIPYSSGSQGLANVQIFASDDDADRGGFILRLEITDDGSSVVPSAEDRANGVDLHLAGEAEGKAFLAAIAGLLEAFHAASHARGVGL